MRDDLDVDPGLVHLLEAQRAEIAEALGHAGAAARPGVVGREFRLDLGVEEMLFERDDERLGGHGDPSW